MLEYQVITRLNKDVSLVRLIDDSLAIYKTYQGDDSIGYDFIRREAGILRKLEEVDGVLSPRLIAYDEQDYGEKKVPRMLIEYVGNRNLSDLFDGLIEDEKVFESDSKAKGPSKKDKNYFLRQRLTYLSKGLDSVVAFMENVTDENSDLIHHNDLKPENFVVNPNGEVYLIDFGLAESPKSAQKRFDRYRLIGGTSMFQPNLKINALTNEEYSKLAEQCEGYSAAVTLVSGLTGQRWPIISPVVLSPEYLIKIEKQTTTKIRKILESTLKFADLGYHGLADVDRALNCGVTVQEVNTAIKEFTMDEKKGIKYFFFNLFNR